MSINANLSTFLSGNKFEKVLDRVKHDAGGVRSATHPLFKFTPQEKCMFFSLFFLLNLDRHINLGSS